ncbi:HEAT repeat-containing protein [Rhizobiales bacterium GAS113]|nr:HEAT repeat-containing protein [Rhizobiales bacterium GAS113]
MIVGHNGAMNAGQLDLFSAPTPLAEPARRPGETVAGVDVAALSDDALIAAIPDASIVESRLLAAEAGRRRIAAAIPALETLCLRLTGFGQDSLVREQVAALEALSVIGGGAAGQAVARILDKGAVQGPTLAVAAAAAAQLKVKLLPHIALALLRNPDPLVRANACRCARPHPATLPVLVDLLGDLHERVSIAAACALGRAGRLEARPLLTRLLREAPSTEVIAATPAIADEECCVLLGRIARDRSALGDAALDALDSIDDPRAQRILASLAGPARDR